MKAFLIFLGTFILTAFLFAVPILCTVSFALHWAESAQFLLTILTAVSFY